MKLGQYIKELLELQQQVGPDVELHYASDDEGNAYPVLQYSPSIRLIKKSTDESDLYSGDISTYSSIYEYMEDCDISIEEAEAELRPIVLVN